MTLLITSAWMDVGTGKQMFGCSEGAVAPDETVIWRGEPQPRTSDDVINWIGNGQDVRLLFAEPPAEGSARLRSTRDRVGRALEAANGALNDHHCTDHRKIANLPNGRHQTEG